MAYDLIVIGGGAAGMMAAISAARAGGSVRLLERNQKVGRKLYITGKGRCNVTNHCAAQQVLAAVPDNGRFLYSALAHTPPDWVEDFFTSLGVPLKVERGNRVFPQSDKSADIIDALFFELRRLKVHITQDRAKKILLRDGAVSGVAGEKQSYTCKAIILASGGMSYPATGSTGDGYNMARQLGHTIVPPRPSLIPLEAEGELCPRMQGLSLKNVQLKMYSSHKKLIFQEQGEMIFTHFGISGPLVLSASAHMREFETEQYSCVIDLKPALDEKTLDVRLSRELSEGKNKAYATMLANLLPRRMVPLMMDLTGILPDKPCHAVTKEERQQILNHLKEFRLTISAPRPIEEAIITAGGIKLGEVNPKTMASKLVDGLYFAGEVLDLDAYTGGFNLQIAWSTGRTAGESAAESLA